MSATRVPFDPSLPFVVASQELACGAKKLKRGDPLPWRELSLSEYDLAMLWIANQVDCTATPAKATTPAPSPPKPAKQPQPRR